MSLKRESDIRDSLNRLPEGLTKTYHGIFEEIKRQKGSEEVVAIRAFQWIMGSIEPLEPEALVAAVCHDPEKDLTYTPAIDIDIEYVTTACKNLIEVTKAEKQPYESFETRQICQWSHLSVREFFEEYYQDTFQQSALVVAKVYISLAHNVIDWESLGYRQRTPSTRFWHYVGSFWHDQTRYALSFDCPSSIPSLLREFLVADRGTSTAYKRWLMWTKKLPFSFIRDIRMPKSNLLTYGFDELYQSDTSLLPVCAFGFDELLREIVAHIGHNAVQQSIKDFNLLIVAIKRHNHAIIQILLDNGADVNAQEDASHGSALATAAFTKDEKTVQILLKNSADVNGQIGQGHGSALAAAAFSWRLSIMRLLLNRGAEITIPIRTRYGSALGIATNSSNVPMVQLLIDHGADINAHLGGDYGSALASAANGGSTHMLKFLLDKGADVNMEIGGKFGSALAAAALSWNDHDSVQMLLNNGANVNAQIGGRYGSALAAACVRSANRSDKIAQLLLDNGADINMRIGGRYGSALTAAAAKERIYSDPKLIQILLDNGADINAQIGGRYGNALTAAAARAKKVIVQLLINNGADVNAQTEGCYGNALTAAIYRGSESIEGWRNPIFQLLLDNGADESLVQRHTGPLGNIYLGLPRDYESRKRKYDWCDTDRDSDCDDARQRRNGRRMRLR